MAPVISTGFGPASSDFAERNHTPFFSWSFQPNECNSPWSYGFNGCLVGTKALNSSVTDPISGVLGDPKNIRLAIQQDDNPSGLVSLTLFSRLINLRRGQTVYSQANMPTAGTVDYTPYVQAILNAKPTLVILGPILAQTIGMSAALKTAGYKGAIQDFQDVPARGCWPSNQVSPPPSRVSTSIPRYRRKSPDHRRSNSWRPIWRRLGNQRRSALAISSATGSPIC